ncbi:MAG: peroxiredoxin [Hydrotalea sp.]|nr:peroxiredoxin [Hydrotalea sp.]
MVKQLPSFKLPDQTGATRNSDEFKTDWLVLYFYPKDNTPGCTVEANDFQRQKDKFSSKKCQIIGVSKDSVKSHQGFCTKQSLNFTLLSDENGELCNAMGTWVEKSMYGKKYMGIDRATFLYKDGQLVKEWRKVRVPGHVDEVLAAIS